MIYLLFIFSQIAVIVCLFQFKMVYIFNSFYFNMFYFNIITFKN